jgi:hypothetical protein
METYRVTISGQTPLLLHADNIEWADRMDAWKNDPANKAKSKAGDDRTPPWRWLGCLTYDEPNIGVVALTGEYIMSCLLSGGAEVPTGKGQKTFKSQTQSGILCEEMFWPLMVSDDANVLMKDIHEVGKLKTFQDQSEAVKELGFSLFVKRAVIGQRKHIRVRPRFDTWSATGTLLVIDEQIAETVLRQILEICGKRKGLGDWRPGARRPGQFGRFEASLERI